MDPITIFQYVFASIFGAGFSCIALTFIVIFLFLLIAATLNWLDDFR